jgi:hypothetical protein
VLRSADVLQPSAATTTVTFRDGGLRVQDGPFAGTKEALAGTFVLEVVLGFTAERVGHAFSVPPPTMATRLVRSKKRIKAAGIPSAFRTGPTSRRG